MSGDDDTVRLRPRHPPPPRRRWWPWALLLVVAGLGGAGWLALRDAPAPGIAVPAAPPLLDQAGIAAHRAEGPAVLRWSANPRVWVLDFPSLDMQGAALNRVAALLEKAGAPRDRVLDDAALAAAIAADGRTAATWYAGHNYRLSDLERFFALAAMQGVRLNAAEAWVQAQAALARRLEGPAEVAILGIPAVGGELDMAARAAILRHELAHGQFFTLPSFAAHVLAVWRDGMDAGEREAMRAFLRREGYDPTNEEVMANEAMAYLLHTPDPQFFDPLRDLGWGGAQAARLRALLAAGAPAEP